MRRGSPEVKDPALVYVISRKTIGYWMWFDRTYGMPVHQREKGTFEGAT
jgi:hypothetical protein